MKNLSPFLFGLFIVHMVTAQEVNILAGPSLSTGYYSSNETTYKAHISSGMMAGISYSHPIFRSMSVETGPRLTSRRIHVDDPRPNTYIYTHYLELPVAITYEFGDAKIKPFVTTGGFGSLAFHAGMASDWVTEDNRLLSLNKDEGGISPTNYGLHLGGGIEINKYSSISIICSPALKDISNSSTQVIKYNSVFFQFSLNIIPGPPKIVIPGRRYLHLN